MAYPPGPERIVALPAYGANSAPTDRFWIVSAAVGFGLGSAADRYITPDEFLAEITRNISDVSLAFGNGAAISTVSAANKGKVRYNATSQSFQVSENGGAYTNLVKGSGAATRVAFWSGTSTLSSNSDFYWDDVNERLGVGVGSSPGAPIDVLADGTALAQQWRQNAGPLRMQMVLDNVPEASLGTSTNHTFHLLTNNLQRLTIENGGLVGINKSSVVQAQLQVVSIDDTTETLILNSAPTPSVNIAEFYNDSSLRFTFSPSANLTIGLAGASGETGSLSFAVNGQANLTTLRAGTAPVSANTLFLPSDDPAAGEFLKVTSFGSNNIVTEWASAGGISGSGAATRVAFWSGTSTLSSNSDFYWDDVNERLGVGVGSSPGAPIDVLADGTALAQQWRQNAGSLRMQMILDNVPEASLGTSTNHTFHLLTNNLQRLTIENGGLVGINKTSVVQAQLQVVSVDATTETLILNSAPTPSVNIAEFYNDSSLRFTFSPSANLTIGLAGASGETGSLSFAVNGQANLTTLRAGSAPVSANTLFLPSDDPAAGEFLKVTSFGSNNIVTEWASATASPGTPLNSVQFNNASAFGGNSGFLYIPASTSGNELALSSSTISSGNLFSIALTGTAAASNTKTALNVSISGANVNASQTTYAAQFSNTSTGTTNTNIAIIATASAAATQNLAGVFVGDVAFGGTTSSFPVITNRSGAAQLETKVAGGGAVQRALIWAGGIVSSTANVGTYTGAVFIEPGTPKVNLGSNLSLQWTSTSDAVSGTADTGLVRAATGVIRSTNASTGTGSVLIAPSTASITGSFTVLPDNAATNSLVTVARLGVNSTGTAADGFGANLSWSAETSTTNDTETGRDSVFWSTATHAIRTSAHSWTLVNSTTLTEAMRLTTPSNNVGSPFVLTLHGGTNPNVWTSGSFAAKLYLIDGTLPAVGVAAHFSATGADAPSWQLLRGRGTNASPTAIQNSDRIGTVQFCGQTSTSTNNFAIGAEIRVSATENWSAGNNGCTMFFRNANNAGTITDRMQITETGTIRISASSGTYSTTTLLQVGNYPSWNTSVVAAFYTGANTSLGMQIIGTNGQTANMLEVFRDSVTPNLLTLAASGVLGIRAGLNTGTLQARVGGIIHEDFTPVANGTTVETDLMTFSIPGNTLGTNNDSIVADQSGEFVSPTGNSQLRVYLDGDLIFDTGSLAFTTGAWRFQITIERGSATDTVSIATFSGDTSLLPVTVQARAQTPSLNAANTFKVTAQGAASDEIFQTRSVIYWFPAAQ